MVLWERKIEIYLREIFVMEVFLSVVIVVEEELFLYFRFYL